MWEKAVVEFKYENESSAYFVAAPFSKDKKDIVAIIIVAVSTSLVIVLTIELKIIPQWVSFLGSSPLLKAALYPLAISWVIFILGLFFRTILWLRYKPLTLEETDEIDWPSISVIMPAFNEENLVLQAIDSVFGADYPRHRLEVIAIDDGSNDNTYGKLRLAKKRYGEYIRIIRFKKNLGKRLALYSGIKASSGEIIVTIDTDSRVGQNALKNIVLPLLLEPRTGAVAGRVAALNEKENLLTRMLAVRYSIAFDFGRAYQSVYGGVLVCPGALSAFRREAIGPILKEWSNQVFMGKSCTHGEDRALTNLVLRNGYLSKYQSNAVVYTQVPNNFRQMNRMHIRWTRSYIRESIIFAKFIISSCQLKNRYLPALDFLFLNFLYPFHLFMTALIFCSFFYDPLFILQQLAFLASISLIISMYYLRTQKTLTFIYGIPYGILTTLCFWWVFPYSLLTLNEPSWLTR